VIPVAFLQAWSAQAPWPDLRQVEQDLIISRVLCDLFNSPALTGKIAFRGGTAIHKLLFKQPLRYSEDIDLVQTKAEPIGATVDAVRDALSWLGRCQREQAGHSMHLVFKFSPEVDPQATLELKVEINTREHTNLLGIKWYPFSLENDWCPGKAGVTGSNPVGRAIFPLYLQMVTNGPPVPLWFDSQIVGDLWDGQRAARCWVVVCIYVPPPQ